MGHGPPERNLQTYAKTVYQTPKTHKKKDLQLLSPSFHSMAPLGTTRPTDVSTCRSAPSEGRYIRPRSQPAFRQRGHTWGDNRAHSHTVSHGVHALSNWCFHESPFYTSKCFYKLEVQVRTMTECGGEWDLCSPLYISAAGYRSCY